MHWANRLLISLPIIWWAIFPFLEGNPGEDVRVLTPIVVCGLIGWIIQPLLKKD